MKHVFYEDNKNWMITTEENYKAQIKDVNKVTKLPKAMFPTRDNALDYIFNIIKCYPYASIRYLSPNLPMIFQP